MDSLLVEALAESRRVLEDLPDGPQTRRLRLRREALERAADGHVVTGDRQLVTKLASLVVTLRDEVAAFRDRRRVIIGALEEAMD